MQTEEEAWYGVPAWEDETDDPPQETMEGYNCGRLYDDDLDPNEDGCPLEGSAHCSHCPWKPK